MNCATYADSEGAQALCGESTAMKSPCPQRQRKTLALETSASFGMSNPLKLKMVRTR